MKQKKSIAELKEILGLNYPITDGRAELEKMIDPNKYYIVQGHILPFMGATVLKKNFQPSFIKEDLGYKITAAQWKEYNEKLKEQQAWLHQQQQQTQE